MTKRALLLGFGEEILDNFVRNTMKSCNYYQTTIRFKCWVNRVRVKNLNGKHVELTPDIKVQLVLMR